jgi:WD40 repeat protein
MAAAAPSRDPITSRCGFGISPRVRLRDLATGAILRTLKGHTRSVRAVAVLADGSHALSGSSDHTLRLWDLATGATLRTLERHTSRRSFRLRDFFKALIQNDFEIDNGRPGSHVLGTPTY